MGYIKELVVEAAEIYERETGEEDFDKCMEWTMAQPMGCLKSMVMHHKLMMANIIKEKK